MGKLICLTASDFLSAGVSAQIVSFSALETELYDVMVCGGRPAGCGAAIATKRCGLRVLASCRVCYSACHGAE